MEYKLIVSEQELKIIGAALDELPRKFCQPVINKLEKQISEQNKKEKQEPELPL